MLPQSHKYVVDMAGQLGLIEVFMGGVAVTLMSLMLGHERRQRRIGVAVVLAAAAALGFIVGVMGAIQLQASFHPDAPQAMRAARSVASGRLAVGLGTTVGMVCLFACIGVCGWIRSRATGLCTTSLSVIGLLAAGWILLN